MRKRQRRCFDESEKFFENMDTYICDWFDYDGMYFTKRKELVCNNKSAAIFIFFHLLWLYPGGTPKLGLEFFTLWILISITLSKNSFYKEKMKYPNLESN